MTCDEENQGAVEAVADALRNRPVVQTAPYYTEMAMVAIKAYRKWERSNALDNLVWLGQEIEKERESDD